MFINNWANNCGKELFTLGWVKCGESYIIGLAWETDTAFPMAGIFPTPPDPRDVGTGARRRKHNLSLSKNRTIIGNRKFR